MKIDDKVFKTIFYLYNYQFHVTIPVRDRSSFMFRVIDCGKDCNEIELYLIDYMKLHKTYNPHIFFLQDNHKVFLTDIAKSNIINWKTVIERKSLAYMNKWKPKYFRISKIYKKLFNDSFV